MVGLRNREGKDHERDSKARGFGCGQLFLKGKGWGEKSLV